MSSDRSPEALRAALDELSEQLRAALTSDELVRVGDTSAAASVLEYLNEIDAAMSGVAFLKLLSRLQRNPEPIGNPVGYLNRLVKNARIDEERRSRREITGALDWDMVPDSVDGPDRRLYASAVVAAALRQAAAHGEHKLVACATTWLDMADELGRAPTSREVAERIGSSHQTVINRLAALERFIDQG